jgi:hypothetical protein
MEHQGLHFELDDVFPTVVSLSLSVCVLAAYPLAFCGLFAFSLTPSTFLLPTFNRNKQAPKLQRFVRFFSSSLSISLLPHGPSSLSAVHLGRQLVVASMGFDGFRWVGWLGGCEPAQQQLESLLLPIDARLNCPAGWHV